MTPRQIQRAVADVIAQEMPSMMDALAERLFSRLAPHLAPLFVVQPAQPPLNLYAAGLTAETRQLLAEAMAHPGVALPAVRLPAPADPVEEAPTPAPAATGPWTAGEGSRRRLTEAGLARVSALLAEGKTDSQIAAEMGITRRAVQLRRTNGTESAATWATTPQPDRDLARAEKNRQYQREWYRKRRAKGGTHGEAEPVVIGVQVDVPVIVADARTVAVVPAAEVPARIVPPAPLKIALPKPPAPASHHPHTPREAVPMDPAQLEPVPASYEDALDWLFAELTRQKMPTAEIETRLAQLSTKQLLATCNAQRVKAGLSPYVLTERAA